MRIDIFEDDEAYLSVILQSNAAKDALDNLATLSEPQALMIEVDESTFPTFSYQGKSYVLLFSWNNSSNLSKRVNYISLIQELYAIDNLDFFERNLDEVLSFEIRLWQIVETIRFFFKG